jgi:hypothetical protein
VQRGNSEPGEKVQYPSYPDLPSRPSSSEYGHPLEWSHGHHLRELHRDMTAHCMKASTLQVLQLAEAPGFGTSGKKALSIITRVVPNCTLIQQGGRSHLQELPVMW